MKVDDDVWKLVLSREPFRPQSSRDGTRQIPVLLGSATGLAIVLAKLSQRSRQLGNRSSPDVTQWHGVPLHLSYSYVPPLFPPIPLAHNGISFLDDQHRN